MGRKNETQRAFDEIARQIRNTEAQRQAQAALCARCEWRLRSVDRHNCLFPRCVKQPPKK